jgi:hypothetical protein
MKIPLQFSLRTLLEVIVIAAFVCALIYARAPSSNSGGRYQLIVVAQPPSNPQTFIFDTQTGKSWHYTAGAGTVPPELNP